MAARPLPDLVISDVNLRATGQCGPQRPVIEGTVVVRNIGKTHAQIFTTRDMVRVRIRGVPDMRADMKFVNSMRPGETQVVTIRLGMGKTVRISGVLMIDIDVDPEKVFAEADEDNNRRSVRITIDCEKRAGREAGG